MVNKTAIYGKLSYSTYAVIFFLKALKICTTVLQSLIYTDKSPDSQHYYFVILKVFHVFFAGNKFLCSVLVAPVKNEHAEIIMFIINYEDITDAPNKFTPLPEIRTLSNSKASTNSNYAKRTCLALMCQLFVHDPHAQGILGMYVFVHKISVTIKHSTILKKPAG